MSVAVRDLTKRYAGAESLAVDDVSFDAEQGELLVLLGPSGCGKTTLLRMIAGLEAPTDGTISIGGRDVTGVPPRDRAVAMVFQSYALYPHKTARQNIEFPLRAAKVGERDRTEKVTWAAALLGIESLLDRRPRHLSGGERQRVALARALVREPQLFLLDEPLSNLDAKLRALARTDLKQFQQRVGTTTIYVTHDQVEAMGLGDRVAVMSGGKIRQIGTPQDVYENPADTFVATFLGAPPMNLIRHENSLIGFRPENVLPLAALGPSGVPDGHAQFRVSIERVEYLSGDRHLYGTAVDLGEPTAVIIRLPATVMTPIDAGTEHVFVIPNDKLREFDATSGESTTR